MHASQALAFLAAAATLVSAAPAAIHLRADDVLLYGQGRYTVMKRADFDELEAYRRNNTVPPMPAHLDPNFPCKYSPYNQSRSALKQGLI